MKQLTLTLAMLAMAGVASANLFLVPNGDFEDTPTGIHWVSSGPAVAGLWANGGAGGGGCGTLDSRLGWGVFVSNGGAPLPLSYFGGLALAPGDTITIKMDMKAFYDNPAGTGGLKMESWTADTLLSDSGDMNKIDSITTEWSTFSWDYTIAAGATHLKFVPLSVSGDVIGFDNVGVVPEPATLGLLGLASVAMIGLRRFRD